MKDIKILIDTNIILDWIMKRHPNSNNAKRIIEVCLFGNIDAYLTAHTITDLFYILRKDFSIHERKNLFTLLCCKFNIIAEDKSIILETLNNELWPDLEDGLQMQCAKVETLDYIVTQNLKDFKNASVKVLNSENFVQLLDKLDM